MTRRGPSCISLYVYFTLLLNLLGCWNRRPRRDRVDQRRAALWGIQSIRICDLDDHPRACALRIAKCVDRRSLRVSRNRHLPTSCPRSPVRLRQTINSHPPTEPSFVPRRRASAPASVSAVAFWVSSLVLLEWLASYWAGMVEWAAPGTRPCSRPPTRKGCLLYTSPSPRDS